TNTSGAGVAAAPAQSRLETRLPSRGLFPAPAELVNVDPERHQDLPAETHDERSDAEVQAAAEQWRDTSVKAVRRVRIEGGLPPRSDTVTPRPLDRASARDVWARRQQAPWRSLDTMIAGPVVPPEEAAEAFSEST